MTAATDSIERLPTPEQRPDAAVVIYDGHCVFCRRQVVRFHRFDWLGALCFLSLHEPIVSDRYPDLSHEQLMAEMVIVDPTGRRHCGAEAIRYVSRRLPILWPMMLLLHIPGTLPFWRYVYQHIARRRYLFGRVRTCDDGACHLHGEPYKK